MSRIDDLIAEHCPDGVQMVALGDIGVIFGGLTGKSKADFSNGNARFVSYINVFNNIAVDTRANDFVAVAPGERQRELRPGDILFTGSSETLDEVAISSVVMADVTEPLYLNSFSIGYRFNEPGAFDPGFTKHLFRSNTIRKQLIRTASGVTRFNVSKARLAAVKIPMPPLAIQREVSLILDSMTELQAELQGELKVRSRQYAFYRDALLTLERVQWVAMSEICLNVSSGATPLAGRPEYYERGHIPWLRTQEVVWRDIADTDVKITERALHETAVKWIPVNCVIVAISGASAARVAVNKIPLTTNQHCCNLEIDPGRADYRYVFHWLTANYEKLKALGQGARSDLNAAIIKSFPIALPPVSEQRRIAALLDKFDTLVNDLSIGLPAEIKARKKQYEYYRDRLLTFKELAA